MVACARRKLLGNQSKAVFHVWNRRVRQAFLCGKDRHSGWNFSHRRDLEAILDHFEVQPEAWHTTLESYDTSFCHAVGREESLAGVAERMGVCHLKGVEAARRVFR